MSVNNQNNIKKMYDIDTYLFPITNIINLICRIQILNIIGCIDLI